LKIGHGSYHAYIEVLWAVATDIRPEFGRRPNRTKVELSDEEKKCALANPSLRPFADYDDCLMMTFWKID
jgi:hypothetical protein